MDSIRVLYDYQAFAMQKHGGVSRCFVELCKHMPKEIQTCIAIKESDNVYLKELKEVHPANDKYNNFLCNCNFRGKGHLHWLYDKLTHGGYYPDYNQNYCIKILQKGEFDVFHPTFFSDYFLPYLNDKPFVLTIHDMIPELYPQYFKENDIQILMKKKLAPLASAIIVVSEKSKQDVIRLLDVSEKKVHVVYHGCSFPKISQPQFFFSNPYILYVGGRFSYKNFINFVKHVAPFLMQHSTVSIVCTGDPFGDNEIEWMRKNGVEDRFVHIWASTDEDLFSLYHHALCFVFPSECEGFGIPILEAYQAECLVMLNHVSCFQEIAGDAAIYFEMNSEFSNLVEKLNYVCSMNANEKKSLLRKQRERLEKYSWERSALQLTKIYENVCNMR